MQKNLNMKKITLTAISDTRWVCCYKKSKAVIENFKSIVTVLQNEVDKNNDRDISRSIGWYINY